MSKKSIALLLAVTMILLLGVTAKPNLSNAAPKSAVSIILDGQKVSFPDSQPFIDANNRTMIPLRFISEKLGGVVSWDLASRTVGITLGAKEISMPLDSTTAMVNGKAVLLDTAAVLADGRTVVPLRFVSEVLGSKVAWDAGSQSVVVTKVTSEGDKPNKDVSAKDTSSSPSTDNSSIVTFADKQFEKVIRGKIQKPSGALTSQDVLKITSISEEDYRTYANSRIRSIDGIGSLKNLEELNLSFNLIEDVSPLSGNNSLLYLNVTHNKISDLSGLRGLTQLKSLVISNNFVNDLTAISGLTNLEYLNISENQIKSISMLNKLTRLEELNISHNIISDISVVGEMVSLERLNIDNNPVLDVSAALAKTNLGGIDFAKTVEAGKVAHDAANTIAKTAFSDEEKEKAAFDYIVKHVNYDDQYYNSHVQTKTDVGGLYGALVEQMAVCEGYAQSMKILGQLLGLDIIYIEGLIAAVPDSSNSWQAGHAWNMIRLNGSYVHVDATWGEGQFESSPPQYNYYNLNQQQIVSGRYFDLAYYPEAKQPSNPADSHVVHINLNAEIPATKDLLAWVKVHFRYTLSGTDHVQTITKTILFPAGETSVSADMYLPPEAPLVEQSIVYQMNYELFDPSSHFQFQTENKDFSYYGYSQGDGFTCLTCHSNAVLKPGDHLNLTLLKKNSSGTSYNQTVALQNEANYAFDGSQFKLYIMKSFPQPNGPDYNIFGVTNDSSFTLPAYSAIYITAGTNYVKFEDDYYNYNFGGYVLVANHSNQPKTIKVSEIDYDVQRFYSDRMGTVGNPDGTSLQLKGTGPYIRMISFDGDFDEKEEYKKYKDDNKILTLGSWITVNSK